MSSSLTSRDFNDTLYTQISDDSFLKSEQDCRDELEYEDLLGSQEVPDLNDTLDEINFILELGNKLNLEGKLRKPNIKHGDNSFTGTSHSFKAAQMIESNKSLEESTRNSNKTEDISGISFLVDKSEILELKKFNKFSNDTTNIEDISEIADVSESQDQNIIIDDSFILNDTKQSGNESYFNSIVSENGSIDEENDESTIEDDDCCEKADISEIDLIDDSLEDSVIEIFD